MKTVKRIISVLLMCVMCIGTFLGLGNTAYAATEKMTLYTIFFPRGGDPNKSGWGNPDMHFMNGWSVAARGGSFTVYVKDSYSGLVVYCLEPGIPPQHGKVYPGYGEDYWDNYPSTLNTTISPTVVKAYIGRILQYGYQGTASTEWRTGNTGDANKLAHVIATQLLIWETIVGERDGQFNHVWGSSKGFDNIIEIIPKNNPIPYSRVSI